MRLFRFGFASYKFNSPQAMALVAMVLDFVAVGWGLGRYTFYLNVRQQRQQAFYNVVSQVFCILGLAFCKISLCISLLRIVQGSHTKKVKWILYVTMILVFAVNAAVCITFFVQCRPVEKVFNPALRGVCWVFPTETNIAILQGGMSPVLGGGTPLGIAVK